MKNKRRKFIRDLSMTGIFALSSPVTYSKFKSVASLKVLVLGGTNFLGPAIVKALVKGGHNVSLFNRGITNPHLFPDLKKIRGDREKGLSGYSNLQNRGENWDVIIDVWPQHSRLVDTATAALQKYTKHYVFISSIAVYKDFNTENTAEDYELVSLPNDKTKWEYPEEKVAAEAFVVQRFPNNHTILRPGAIKGWRDPVYELLYWLIKLERGESLLAPGDGSDPLQFIDVNDVGRFAVTTCENQTFGIYNCIGPRKDALSWKVFLETAKQHLNSSSELYWSSQDFLKTQEVQAWNDLPMWAPISDDYFMRISNAKSVSAGFVYTPIEKTISDCLSWHRKHGNTDIVFGEGKEPIGLERSKELEVISALQKGK